MLQSRSVTSNPMASHLNPYNAYSSRSSMAMPTGRFPVHPDVRFKRLSFYDIEAELLKPSTLSKFKLPLKLVDPLKIIH